MKDQNRQTMFNTVKRRLMKENQYYSNRKRIMEQIRQKFEATLNDYSSLIDGDELVLKLLEKHFASEFQDQDRPFNYVLNTDFEQCIHVFFSNIKHNLECFYL